MPKIVIACPMPSTPTKNFLDSLPDEVDLIVIDDSNGKLDLPKRDNIYLCDYKEQKRILGKHYDSYIQFHKSSACRNVAHLYALKQGYDVIIALDYDCVVPSSFMQDQLAVYEDATNIVTVTSNQEWVNPLGTNSWFSRGFPYSMRTDYKESGESFDKNGQRIVLNMGLWENVVDINGIDKVLEKAPTSIDLKADYSSPSGYIPLCGMNNSFLAEITPAYFFLPNFKIGNWEVSRHDDIWGGYIFQKLAQKRNDRVTYGKPVVFHERESHQPRVLYYEHYMHLLGPYFYDLVDSATENIPSGSYNAMFAEFTNNFTIQLEKKKSNMPLPYYDGFLFLSRFFELWTTLFQKL